MNRPMSVYDSQTDHGWVDVVVATYNGARYLDEQFESVLAQTHPHWRVIARDDGSSDRTPDLLAAWQQRYPDRFRIVQDNHTNLGAAQNFSVLLSHTTAPYVALCDQDDVWLPHKLEDTLTRMYSDEARYSPSTPLLVHTDLEVVDTEMKHLAPSLWGLQYLDPNHETELSRLLTQNVVTGCTALLNRALVDRVGPIPIAVIMHDWWIALTAASLGHVSHLDESTVRYRQHHHNDIGAKVWGPVFVARYVRSMFGKENSLAASLRSTQSQATELLERFRDDLTCEQAHTISTYAKLSEQPPFARRLSLVRHGFLKTGTIRNIGLFINI
jgi:glycosyltransferase involved in cell wall biosynthesis